MFLRIMVTCQCRHFRLRRARHDVGGGRETLPCNPSPACIEHLSDNGSAYTARDTRLFAQALNLTSCFTPVASPQSNGMSEAFVKTLKRDYIRISALPDAQTALRLIDGWIEDYNEIHPHSALKMASPRQFIRAKSI